MVTKPPSWNHDLRTMVTPKRGMVPTFSSWLRYHCCMVPTFTTIATPSPCLAPTSPSIPPKIGRALLLIRQSHRKSAESSCPSVNPTENPPSLPGRALRGYTFGSKRRTGPMGSTSIPQIIWRVHVNSAENLEVPPAHPSIPPKIRRPLLPIRQSHRKSAEPSCPSIREKSP